MKMKWLPLLLCTVMFSVSAEEYRIMVDSVISRTKPKVPGKFHLYLEEKDVKEFADAGFTHLASAYGFNYDEQVTRFAGDCAKHGIKALVWMRGALEVPQNDKIPEINYGSFGDEKTPRGKAVDGDRYVSEVGQRPQIFSPHSDVYWKWLTGHLVRLAGIAKKNPSLDGILIDFENYYCPGGGGGFLYTCSYDAKSLRRFAAANKISLPESMMEQPVKEIMNELKKRNLLQKFKDFQAADLRKRAAELRKTLTKVNPDFRIYIYPAADTFSFRQIIPELDTPEHPVIMVDWETYFRHSVFASQKISLELQSEILKRKIRTLRKVLKRPDRKILGGVDPIHKYDDPEYSAANGAMGTAVGGGYWVFYEGGRVHPTEQHPHFMREFRKVNRKLAAGKKNVWLEPRQSPEPSWLDFYPDMKPYLNYIPSNNKGFRVKGTRFDSQKIFILAAKKGEEISLRVRHHPVADLLASAAYSVLTGDGKIVTAGKIPYNQEKIIQFKSPVSGALFMGIASGYCGYSIMESNTAVGVVGATGNNTPPNIRVLANGKNPDKLYFKVPKNTKSFSLQATCYALEYFTINILRPDGSVAATGRTAPGKLKIDFKIPSNSKTDTVWALEFPHAVWGVRFSLDKKLPGIFGFTPDSIP